MIDMQRNTSFTNRDFISRLRAKLDAAGHADIAVRRHWIDEDEPGHPFLLRVPIGPELVVPLKPLDGFFGASAGEEIDSHVGHFADALITLKAATRTLETYARDVRRAACREVSAARADGLDVALEGVGLTPTYAFHLTGSDWKEAADHVLASVRIRCIDFRLRPTSLELWVEEPEDVAKELAPILRDQREHQTLLAELEHVGADLRVDGITLDLLAAHDLPADQILREVWKRQCVNMTVQVGEHEATLGIISCRGEATASIELEEVCWNGRYLWFRDDAQATGNAALVGKSLGDRVRHPALSRRQIVAVEEQHRDHMLFDLSDKLLFDADTGRIWPEKRVVT